MGFFSEIQDNEDAFLAFKKSIFSRCNQAIWYVSMFAFLAMLFDVGFRQWYLDVYSRPLYNGVLLFLGIALVLRIIVSNSLPSKYRLIPAREYLLTGALWVLFISRVFVDTRGFLDNFLDPDTLAYIAILLVFVVELSKSSLSIGQLHLGASLIFVISFALLMLFGALLLMLPRATHQGISFVDALFTSVSAASVTGLSVVDTEKYFTRFGQSIILLLIQLGGLGIMTFTSFFGFLFTGGTSLQNQLLLKDWISSDRLGEVFRVLFRILFITLIIELLGAVVIFFNTPSALFQSVWQRLFFAFFHAISAFCNAGFSIFSGGLYDDRIRFNYPIHLCVAFLIIFGGIGFAVLHRIYRYIIWVINNLYRKHILKIRPDVTPRWFHLNIKIAVVTTLILLVVGTIGFYIAEYRYSLVAHPTLFGKWVSAFFGAVTPRTAGFNSIDLTQMSLAGVMLTILLMWIGASPGSTGGGIKTTTFAIGTLNIWAVVRGKNRIELDGAEVADLSVRRAFTVISLSLIWIGAATFALTISDSDKQLRDLAFEVFSAYSTVGLTLGITPMLSVAGKLIITLTMFVGRVSLYTILVSFFQKQYYLRYRFPQEEVTTG